MNIYKKCLSVLLILNLYTISVYAENEEKIGTSYDMYAPPQEVEHIRDKHNRALILHGFNTAGSAKNSIDGMPWITEGSGAKIPKCLKRVYQTWPYWY
ncbi:hypothetical protein [Bacillus wiedmannii]|uniref:hypothetical protein n=1 Tax=Bacillus wiedmannii TaxID=1890302 RepID=UPI002E1DA144|nr:hypothetical protein [Bacillus wiedmannii]